MEKQGNVIRTMWKRERAQAKLDESAHDVDFNLKRD